MVAKSATSTCWSNMAIESYNCNVDRSVKAEFLNAMLELLQPNSLKLYLHKIVLL